LEVDELYGFADVVPIFDSGLLKGEFVERLLLLMCDVHLQKLAFLLHEVLGFVSDFSSLLQFIENFVSYLRGPYIKVDVSNAHVDRQFVQRL